MTILEPDNTRSRLFGKALSPDFLWGTATASYQIEGGVHEGGRGESIWDRFSHTPGKTANGDTGDIACDHYHRFKEDVALMKDLGLSAYRFSMAWPRLFPNGKGPLNREGLDFYSRLVDELLSSGIEPFITLYHWDLPQALEDAGGWANIETAEHFAEYAQAAFSGLSDRVSHWITLNEPWCSAHLGYISGEHAPGHHSLEKGLMAGHTLLVAHGLAVQRFRETCPTGHIGITVSLSPAHPATDSVGDKAAAERANAYGNRWFLDPIYKGDYPAEMREAFGAALPPFTPEQSAVVQSPIDFIGANYYFRGIYADESDGDGTRTRWMPPPGSLTTEMGWEVYPEGLRETLCWLADTYDNPLLYVTENGAAFRDEVSPDGRVHDELRRAYLADHFEAAERAMEQGVRLGGYFVWSLLDNFEWGHGYSKRFGIIHVDYATQKRTLKDSALWYAGLICQNAE